MDLAAVSVLVMLGGYCFAYLWRVTTVTTRRAEGHHLYFRAALCGSLLFVLALEFRSVLIRVSPGYHALDSELVEYVGPALKFESGLGQLSRERRAEWIVTALYSLLLGTVCGSLGNWVTPRAWAASRGLSYLDRLLLKSCVEQFWVCLTLQSGKVYVGFVSKHPNPTLEPVAISFLPMFSGNRDAAGHLTLTTDYEAIYSALEAGRAKQMGLPANWQSEFELQIRADEVISAAKFSLAIYAEFNREWRQQIAWPTQTRSSIGTNSRFSGPM